MPSDLVNEIRADLRACHESFSSVHRLMGKEYEFAYELKQYREQRHASANDSGRRIQPVDQEIRRLIRYKAAMVRLKAPHHVSCEPRDDQGDATTARAMKNLLEWETTGKPWKMYEDVDHRAIEMALGMRAGAYRWDWRPDMGKFGEIVPRLVDARRILFPNGYLTPHDPYCDRMYEWFRMPIAEAQRMRGWKGAGKLKSDEGVDFATLLDMSGGESDRLGSVNFSGDSNSENDTLAYGKKDWFTGVMCWKRYGDFEPRPRKLEPDEQYMQCVGCGWQSLPAGDVEQEGFEWPEMAAGACPKCGGVMERQDVHELDPEAARQSKGKRLTVISLNGSVESPLYDGGWPVPFCRTFPYFWLTAYRSFLKAIPESDVSLNVSVVIGINYTKRILFEQAHRSRGLWRVPARGLIDRTGQPHWMGDHQDDVAIYDGAQPTEVTHQMGTPVSPALFQLHGLLTSALRTNEGTPDNVGMSPERSRDIPSDTFAQMTLSGNVPIDDFIKDVYAARTISLGVLSDMIRYTKTRAELVRTYGPDGVMKFESIRGMDLPDTDVTSSSGPSLSRVRQEDAQIWKELMSVPGPIRRRLGQAIGVDAQILREMDAAEQEMAPPVPPMVGPPVPPLPVNGNGPPITNRIARGGNYE